MNADERWGEGRCIDFEDFPIRDPYGLSCNNSRRRPSKRPLTHWYINDL